MQLPTNYCRNPCFVHRWPFKLQPPRRAFTLLELLVVSAISILLMSVGVTVYLSCLRIYRDGQGVTNVYETAKQVNRDLRDLLRHVVPVKGKWINAAPLKVNDFGGGPSTPTVPDAVYTYSGYHTADALEFYYANGYYSNTLWYGEEVTKDWSFSGPQYGGSYWQYRIEGYGRRNVDPEQWDMGGCPYLGWDQDNHSRGWTLPAFYGKRDGTRTEVLQKNNYRIGSWGWPRADYRMDADADDLNNHHNVACWFYSEDKFYNSANALTLDNANIVLASAKFTIATNSEGTEETQLSLLTHHITGFDHPERGGNGKVRLDAAYGNMMRAIQIKPYYLSSGGAITEMGDSEIGANLDGVPVSASAGDKLPRCFDVRYTLRNLHNNQRYKFAFRTYCRINPQ